MLPRKYITRYTTSFSVRLHNIVSFSIVSFTALDDKTKLQITELCGHYTFSKPEVEKEINKLYDNLAAIKIDGRRFVIEKLKEEMEKHVRCFNMEGLTSKIEASL